MSAPDVVIKATLPGGNVALFKNVDDFLLYIAQRGSQKQFIELHQQVTGKTPFAHLYYSLRRQGMKPKFLAMARQTVCEDGATLYEALQQEHKAKLTM